MEMIKISGFLSDSVRKVKHKSAAKMQTMVQTMAEANEGKLESFEVSEPGTALLFVIGDLARQAIMKEFKRLENVVVSEVPALSVQQERNKKEQERANRMRAAAAKRLER